MATPAAHVARLGPSRSILRLRSMAARELSAGRSHAILQENDAIALIGTGPRESLRVHSDYRRKGTETTSSSIASGSGYRRRRRHRNSYWHSQSSSSSSWWSSLGYTVPSRFPLLALSLWSLVGLGSPPTVDPYNYTTHKITYKKVLSDKHVYIEIELKGQKSRDLFRSSSSLSPAGPNHAREEESGGREGVVVIQHVCIKSPDLQIERPYTPINDVFIDGKIKLVVKRVRGGEVGRYIHSLEEGDDIEIRGPITTTSIDLAAYDKIRTVSTGTGLAPFLQLAHKAANLSTDPSTALRLPSFDIYHYLPPPSGASHDLGKECEEMLPALQKLAGEGKINAIVTRVPFGSVLGSSQLSSSAASLQPTITNGKDMRSNAGQSQIAESNQDTASAGGTWWSRIWTSSTAGQTSSIAAGVGQSETDRVSSGSVSEREAVMICLPVGSAFALVGRDLPRLLSATAKRTPETILANSIIARSDPLTTSTTTSTSSASSSTPITAASSSPSTARTATSSPAISFTKLVDPSSILKRLGYDSGQIWVL